jgi:secreted trypsin-like serine protease
MQILQEDKGYEEWGHRSLKQEGMSMSMPKTTMAMLSEISEEVELDEFESTIIGGSEAIPGSRPYLVALGFGDSSFYGQYCAGSLITPNVVLTAAHCILPAEWVEFNRHDLTDHEPGVVRMSVGADHQVIHPAYDEGTLDSDAALIFLPHPVSWITPVKLNENSKVPATAKSAASGPPLDIAGWGAVSIENITYPPVLMETTVNYVTNKQCTSPPFLYQKSDITNNMMCAWADGTNACYGDSGKCNDSPPGMYSNHSLKE